MSSAFATGKWALAECDQCGFQCDYRRLRPLIINEGRTNILVCPDCWVPDQPQWRISPKVADDPQALRNPRPVGNLAEQREITETPQYISLMDGVWPPQVYPPIT